MPNYGDNNYIIGMKQISSSVGRVSHEKFWALLKCVCFNTHMRPPIGDIVDSFAGRFGNPSVQKWHR